MRELQGDKHPVLFSLVIEQQPFATLSLMHTDSNLFFYCSLSLYLLVLFLTLQILIQYSHYILFYLYVYLYLLYQAHSKTANHFKKNKTMTTEERTSIKNAKQTFNKDMCSGAYAEKRQALISQIINIPQSDLKANWVFKSLRLKC